MSNVRRTGHVDAAPMFRVPRPRTWHISHRSSAGTLVALDSGFGGVYRAVRRCRHLACKQWRSRPSWVHNHRAATKMNVAERNPLLCISSLARAGTPNPSIERTRASMALQALISFWTLRTLPARAAHVKR